MLIEQQALLGDAWLKLAVIETLLYKFPSATPGQITQVTSTILSNQYLARLTGADNITGVHGSATVVEAAAFRSYSGLEDDSSFDILLAIFGAAVQLYRSKFTESTLEPQFSPKKILDAIM